VARVKIWAIVEELLREHTSLHRDKAMRDKVLAELLRELDAAEARAAASGSSSDAAGGSGSGSGSGEAPPAGPYNIRGLRALLRTADSWTVFANLETCELVKIKQLKGWVLLMNTFWSGVELDSFIAHARLLLSRTELAALLQFLSFNLDFLWQAGNADEVAKLLIAADKQLGTREWEPRVRFPALCAVCCARAWSALRRGLTRAPARSRSPRRSWQAAAGAPRCWRGSGRVPSAPPLSADTRVRPALRLGTRPCRRA